MDGIEINVDLYSSTEPIHNNVPVIITSNTTDGIACYNQSIELTCQAKGVNVTSYRWTSPTFKQAEVNTSIIVVATHDLVEYTCTVTDANGESGYSSVKVSSNGELICS